MKTILVVDDDKDIVDLLKYNIQKEGYTVLTARNGKQALEQALHRPQLILLDVMMPELDGWEVVKKLKHNPKTTDIPIVFLTAKGSDVDEVLGLELGADDYIQKPISPRKLVARVKAAFRRSAAGAPAEQVIRADRLEINRATFNVRIGKREMFFPRKEFELLALLASTPSVRPSRTIGTMLPRTCRSSTPPMTLGASSPGTPSRSALCAPRPTKIARYSFFRSS